MSFIYPREYATEAEQMTETNTWKSNKTLQG